MNPLSIGGIQVNDAFTPIDGATYERGKEVIYQGHRYILINESIDSSFFPGAAEVPGKMDNKFYVPASCDALDYLFAHSLFSDDFRRRRDPFSSNTSLSHKDNSASANMSDDLPSTPHPSTESPPESKMLDSDRDPLSSSVSPPPQSDSDDLAHMRDGLSSASPPPSPAESSPSRAVHSERDPIPELIANPADVSLFYGLADMRQSTFIRLQSTAQNLLFLDPSLDLDDRDWTLHTIDEYNERIGLSTIMTGESGQATENMFAKNIFPIS